MTSPERGYLWWRDPVFWVSLTAYGINRLAVKPHLGWSGRFALFMQGHFDDLLLVPVALPLFLWGYKLLGLRPGSAPPNGWEVLLHLMLWSLFFKAFAPLILHASVMDPVDVLCYAAGGLAAGLWWNPPQGFERKTSSSASSFR